MNKPKIRIEAPSMGQYCRVYYRQNSGGEVEISDCIRALTVTVEVGKPTVVNLSAISVGGDFDAGLEELALRTVGPTRLGWIRFKLGRVWRRLKYKPRDATRFGAKSREYV